MNQTSLQPMVAACLGFDIAAFREIAPLDWQQVPLRVTGIDGPPPIDVGVWFVGGDPVRVSVGVLPDVVLVGCPAGEWQGKSVLSYRIDTSPGLFRLPRAHPEFKSLFAEAVRVVEDMRTQTFFLCSGCGGLTAPEYRKTRGRCLDCAEVAAADKTRTTRRRSG